MLLHSILTLFRNNMSGLCFRDVETEGFINRDSFIQSHAASIEGSWVLNPGLLTTSESTIALQLWVIKRVPDFLVANDLPGFHFSDY